MQTNVSSTSLPAKPQIYAVTQRPHHGPVQSPDIQDWPISMKSQGHSILPRLCNFLPSFPFTDILKSQSRSCVSPQGYPWHFLWWLPFRLSALKRLSPQLWSLPIGSQTLQITVETDASDYALAAVLSLWLLMVTCTLFHSTPGHFLPWNLITMSMDKELLAYFWSFQTMATLPQRLWTSDRCGHNHRNLQLLFNDKILTCRQARWSEYLFQIQSRICFLSLENSEPNPMHLLDDGRTS